MEQKLDFIEKEIQRLLFFMENLLKLGSKINHSNFEAVVNNIDDKLKKEFNFSLYSLETLSNDFFLNKLTKLSNYQLDEFVLLLSNLEVSAKYNTIKFKGLDEKIVVLVKYLDANSTEFSVQRMQIKDRFKIK